MPQPLRVCLFNPEVQLSLHQPFNDCPDLRIVGQVASAEEMMDWVSRLSVDIAVFNLDCEPALSAIEQVRQMAPRCGIIGVSRSADPKHIIRVMRAGCNQFVHWPVDPNDLREALNQLIAQVSPRVSGSRRVCVLGASGGAGSTAVACNLAIELAALVGSDCGLVDLNLELGDVGCLFDTQPVFSVADVCKENMEIDTTILEKAFHRLACNVAVLVRPNRLEEAYEVTAEGVTQMLSQSRTLFPFIVVDLPRAFDPVTAAALTDADRVLIVAQLTVASIRNATRIHEWLRKMGTPENNIGVVLNRVSSGVGHITAQDVEAHFGRPVFASIPNDYQRVQSSLDIGYSIVKDDPRNPVQLAIRELARKIGSDLLRQEPEQEEVAPLLKRFWRRKTSEKGAPAGV